MPWATVSALIPTYNSGAFICDAVESVLAQTYPLHEIIIVDDGSTDDTHARLLGYGTRIKYIYQPNAGPPAARNTGLSHVTGDFIALLDSDDLWVPEKLALQMNYFEKHPACGLVYSDMKTFDASGIIEESVKISRKLTLPSGRVFSQLFDETLFQTSAVVIRKECVDAIGGFDTKLRMGDDYEYFLRIARHYELGYVDRPLVLYRQHSGQGTRTWGKQLQQGVPWEVLLLQKVLQSYPESIKELGKSRVHRRLARSYFALAYACLNEGEHLIARRLLRAALSHRPGHLGYWRYYLMAFCPPHLLTKFKQVRDGIQGSAEEHRMTKPSVHSP